MKIKLLAYNGVEHYVEIPDDTEKLVITIVSGDMIMHSLFTMTQELLDLRISLMDIILFRRKTLLNQKNQNILMT